MLKESFDDLGHRDFEKWIDIHRKMSPHFEFWYTLLELQCLMLMFVRSLQNGNFEVFVEVLDQILPWIFSFNHTRYARWLPVYVQTRQKLTDQHPEVYEEFKKGRFTVKKYSDIFLVYQMIKLMNKMIRLLKEAVVEQEYLTPLSL